MSYSKPISSLTACILIALFATPVFAQTAADLEAAATIDVNLPPPPHRPLETIKARAQQIKEDAMNARMELHTETRADFKNATSSDERKDVIRNFVGERLDIMKARVASTTELRRDIKGALRWHGGLIRERFAVAIRQFDRIVERIESRIEKLEAEGVAITAAEAELSLAQTAIAEAKTDAQAVADFIGSVEDSQDRATIKAELETKIRTAHASIKAAHQALVKTARALNASKPHINATTTIEVDAATSTN